MSNTRETRPEGGNHTLRVNAKDEKGRSLLVRGLLPMAKFNEFDDCARVATVCFVEQTGLYLINPVEVESTVSENGDITKIFTGEVLRTADCEVQPFITFEP